MKLPGVRRDTSPRGELREAVRATRRLEGEIEEAASEVAAAEADSEAALKALARERGFGRLDADAFEQGRRSPLDAEDAARARLDGLRQALDAVQTVGAQAATALARVDFDATLAERDAATASVASLHEQLAEATGREAVAEEALADAEVALRRASADWDVDVRRRTEQEQSQEREQVRSLASLPSARSRAVQAGPNPRLRRLVAEELLAREQQAGADRVRLLAQAKASRVKAGFSE